MSASLVGSEMCIRDRRTRRGNWASSKAASTRAMAVWSKHLAKSSETVSYTHLTLPTICSV
eukprot:13809905-Alexandrium_andersonii.AAC.1